MRADVYVLDKRGDVRECYSYRALRGDTAASLARRFAATMSNPPPWYVGFERRYWKSVVVCLGSACVKEVV